MIHAHKVPSIVQEIFPRFLWKKNTEQPTIYLTFDDGPVEEVTPWVLQQLQEHQAKATFFCVGENVVKNPEIYQKIKQSGHAVGNHTYHHVKGWNSNTANYIREVKRCHEIMKEDNQLFRPPYGKIRARQAEQVRKMGYQIVMWSVLSGDYHSDLTPDLCLQRLIKHTENGAIVVFHDSHKAKKNLYNVLPKYLTYFRKQGYQFESLC